MNLAIVTATSNPNRPITARCLNSWNAHHRMRAFGEVPVVVVTNGQPAVTPERAQEVGITGHWIVAGNYRGSVPAFRLGVDYVLEQLPEVEIIACLHDDLEILDPEWLGRVIRHFERTPSCGLAGFGGAIGVGADDLYKTPYRPEQLARIGFRSNLKDAEIHGLRSLLVEPVACLDGFSQIGRRAFFKGEQQAATSHDGANPELPDAVARRPWTVLEALGVVHHAYDGMLGCLAARYGWSTWYLPIAAWHHGGQTAVGDSGYTQWALQQRPGGDRTFWEEAHAQWYEHFRDILPLRV